MTDIRQALSRERTRNVGGAVVVAAIVAVIIAESWSGLPVTGSPLHDCWMMTATMAATRIAPAKVRVRSRESACRISITLSSLSSMSVPTGW